MMSVMESLKLSLSDQEQRVYAELFGMWDRENTGKVSGLKAFELFVTSGLAQDVLHQISELSGAKRLGHFGRGNFYVALKLIAAAQTGIPITSESLNSGMEFPLPTFGGLVTSEGRQPVPDQQGLKLQSSDQTFIMVGPGMVPPQTGGIPPPPKHPRESFPEQRIPGYDTQPTQTNTRDSPPGTRSPHFSPSGSPPLSPSHQKVELPVTKPTAPPAGQFVYAPYEGGQRAEKGWAQFDEDNQALIRGVQKEQKQWADFADMKAETSSISSEAESVDDVWSITDEQRDYYINQFMTMQPDMTGVIPGQVAKEFFEKSKLPVQELSKIWQLSDVDRDGSLSLEEFCTAMHLVVLRRNDIELPEHLPPGLMPPSYVPLGSTEEPFASDLPHGSTLKRLTPPSPTPPSPPAPTQWPPANFVAQSPTSSSVSSPGAKPEPVKFEFKPVISDPDSKIVHPVAMRVSPDGQPLEAMERARVYPDGAISAGYEHTMDGSPSEPVLSPTKSRTPADIVDMTVDHQPGPPLTMPLQSRPRPTPKKSQSSKSVPGPSAEPVHPHPQSHPHPHHPLLRPPPSHLSSDSADRPTTLPVTGEMAPPPPPRAKSGHSRSSSLDNQLIDFSDQADVQGAGGQLMPPPAVPPRPSPKDASSVVTHPATGEVLDVGASARTTTEKVSESPPAHEDVSPDETDHPGTIELASLERQASRDQKDLKAVIRKHRERNTTLARFNNELNQELQEVMEQRIALEIQLEHLRPFST